MLLATSHPFKNHPTNTQPTPNQHTADILHANSGPGSAPLPRGCRGDTLCHAHVSCSDGILLCPQFKPHWGTHQHITCCRAISSSRAYVLPTHCCTVFSLTSFICPVTGRSSTAEPPLGRRSVPASHRPWGSRRTTLTSCSCWWPSAISRCCSPPRSSHCCQQSSIRTPRRQRKMTPLMVIHLRRGLKREGAELRLQMPNPVVIDQP